MVDLENIRKIVTSRELTHEQKLMQLATLKRPVP